MGQWLSQEKRPPSDVVIFHHPGRGPWTPSMIPFAVKLETYFRMTKISYQGKYGLTPCPGTGKFPWIEYNGTVLGDSSMIIKYLNKKFDIDLNKDLTPEQRAIARAMQKMIEEHLYWVGVSLRWNHYFDLSLMTRAMGMPYRLVTWFISRKMTKYAWAQGMGRHSLEEMLEIMHDDLQAISDFMGDKPFLMGEKATEVDCAVFGMLSQVRWNMPGLGEEGVRLVEGVVCTAAVVDVGDVM
ncbi:failed axon connections homolog isoform X2 [Haliotis rubra]|uniref:failed axon connections homolog isoform X2 n=1 Tax=Haliotis rubra TaxID=36100 RepID=UPI001EE4FC32|nr:failed axon connections homolog isoform X2 [Haliotis rubra]